MSEAQWLAVITGSFTLLGAAVGALAAIWQASSTTTREKEKDERQRQWALQDIDRDRRLRARDQRCEEAEKFIAAMSQDFHELRTHAQWLLNPPAVTALPSDLHEFGYWQKHVDKSVFFYGPIVAAVSLPEHDLSIPWKQLEQAWKDMANHYAFAWHTVVAQKQKLPDPIQLSEAINATYSAYNKGITAFIVTLDGIRASRLPSSSSG